MKRVLLLGGGLQGLSFGESLFDKGNEYDLSVVSDNYSINKSRFFNKIYEKKDADDDKVLDAILRNEHFDVIDRDRKGFIHDLVNDCGDDGMIIKCILKDLTVFFDIHPLLG